MTPDKGSHFGEIRAHTVLAGNHFSGSTSISFHARPERIGAPPPPSIVIPFRRDADFVDRKSAVDRGTVLAHIDQKCTRPGSRTALVGLGGVGKSQLAIEYAYRTREQSPETWVFWIHASNAARFEESIRDLAGCAEIAGWQDLKADILQPVHNWLHNRANGPWLIILDNVDDADVITKSTTARKREAADAGIKMSRPLLSYIPHCDHGSVLVTSRNRSAALKIVEYADIIKVEPLNIEDAATLFRRKLGQSDADDETEGVTSLVVALDQIPLAIAQAAAYILQRGPQCSVQKYLDDYRASDQRKAGLLSCEGGELRRDGGAKNSILLTWQISFDYIQQARPSATDMLSLMSFCDRQDVPEVLLHDVKTTEQGLSDQRKSKLKSRSRLRRWMRRWTGAMTVLPGGSDGSDINEFEKDVLMLQNYAFIHVSESGQSFEMHRLVQLATLEWLQLHGQKEDWRRRFLSKLCREMPTGEYENWATCRALFPHARWAAGDEPKRRDSVADWAAVMYRAAWYCLDTGNATEAERLSVLAMKARKKILESDHEDVLSAVAMIAVAYRSQGRWEEAERLEVQVMESRKRKLGADHPDTLTSMANLASTYRNQGRWEEAERLEVQVMESRKRKLGADHPSTLTSMANLASTYRNQGRWEEAERLEVQVMESRKRKLGADHPDTLTSMANLAHTCWVQDRQTEAVNLLSRCVEMQKVKLGAGHPDYKDNSTTLAQWESEPDIVETNSGFASITPD